MRLFIYTVCCFVAFCGHIGAQGHEFVLCKKGKPQCQLVAPKDSSGAYIRAAVIMQDLLKEMTGADFELTEELGQRAVVFSFMSKDLYQKAFPNFGEDGFAIVSGIKSKQLYFVSESAKGLENAVYYFFETYLGCRYYAADAVVIPKSTDLRVQYMTDVVNPSFDYREIYESDTRRGDFGAWRRTDNLKGTGSFRNHDGWGLWVHTMHRLVPPELYFESHPTYFALRNGVRIKDQLCLSNEEVLAVTVASLRAEIAKNPTAKYWSVSQMDNYNFCECGACHAADSIEGSHSGSLIRFVNEVAKAFPDKVISTLAYQYTRSAPRVTRPASNVNIMLCTIECNRAKPIAADTSQGAFVHDLEAWDALTDNIIVWDYVVNFSHLVMPFPNWQVLQPNIQLFEKHGVKMLFEQGYNGPSGEMCELRAYLLAELAWNPRKQVADLIDEFLKGYYGAAAPCIKTYLDLQTKSLNESGRALTLYEPPYTHAKGYLSPANLRTYFELMAKARQAVGSDSTLLHRIDMVEQSIRYAYLEVTKSCVFTDDWCFTKNDLGQYVVKPALEDMLDQFCGTAIQFGPSLLHEVSKSPTYYHEIMTDFYATGVSQHKAVGKKITFAEAPSPSYRGNSPESLIDGAFGTEDYQMLWQGWWGKDMSAVIDLGQQDTIQEVQIRFLDNNQAWIMSPSGFDVMVSDDGTHFRTVGEVINQQAGQQITPQIIALTYQTDTLIPARYIKITAHNIGKLPVWRGVSGDAWLFVDEIIIK